MEERLNEIKYEEILAKAASIYQENYEALNSLNEAIRLIPRKDSAYNRMAEVYITLKEYIRQRAFAELSEKQQQYRNTGPFGQD